MFERFLTALHFYGGRRAPAPAPAPAADINAQLDRAFANGCIRCGRRIPPGEACLIYRGPLQVQCIDCASHRPRVV